MTNLERDLFSLITLVSNVTEAYSACLFLENKRLKRFQLTAYHSLSPHVVADASVESGQGFMGWVLENNEPLSVNQFDKDTIVLGYYGRSEDIKSFMAAPLPPPSTRGRSPSTARKAGASPRGTRRFSRGSPSNSPIWRTALWRPFSWSGAP